MIEEFYITGLFYESQGYKFRQHLDIKRRSSDLAQPDLMVVMMNPGSSYPIDGIENNTKPSKAKPDNTQNQIMKVMDSSDFDYARVLNLSDLRTPDSNVLYEFIKSEESKTINHSIFHLNRSDELKSLFIKKVPVIFGWGVNEALIPLAKIAIEALDIEKPLGILKKGTKYSYYHPLPREHKKRLEWVHHVTSQCAVS